jgi:hypothetical protein
MLKAIVCKEELQSFIRMDTSHILHKGNANHPSAFIDETTATETKQLNLICRLDPNYPPIRSFTFSFEELVSHEVP